MRTASTLHPMLYCGLSEPRRLLLCLWLTIGSLGWAAEPFRVETMQKLLRISEAQLSPDGNWVAFAVARTDLVKNKIVRNLWLVPDTGGEARPLTFADKGSNERPRWSPDSKVIYFLSSRVEDTAQVFKLSLAGGEAAQVTQSPVPISSFVL